ncbi:pre-mRNA cleavage complex 2 protein Pcf11 isoform X2 [Chironomus tepperi]|uniref:pre-mRNA cleavage complex 2 protein Pcf11 isoform X2 n=1 Tax=Chironomus tepperi TaxID=113505 RepID=UPI00391F9ED4
MDPAKEKEVEDEYLSSLMDLNVNSKPLINMLTMLAEDNMECGHVIVRAIEKHLAQVSFDVKLPILYLIDSIVKNVGAKYKQLFAQNIVNIFCGVFEKVNEKVREKMFNLRQTWNDVFPQTKLYALDVKVNVMDSNWPITAKVVPKSVHVNPNFLKNSETQAKEDLLKQMQAKERELLELRQRKIELELLVTKKKIAEQEKEIRKGPSVGVPSIASVAVNPSVMPPIASTAMPTIQSHPAHQGGRIRIAPVSSAMIQRPRDPRLLKSRATVENTAINNQQLVTPSLTPIDILGNMSATKSLPRIPKYSSSKSSRDHDERDPRKRREKEREESKGSKSSESISREKSRSSKSSSSSVDRKKSSSSSSESPRKSRDDDKKSSKSSSFHHKSSHSRSHSSKSSSKSTNGENKMKEDVDLRIMPVVDTDMRQLQPQQATGESGTTSDKLNKNKLLNELLHDEDLKTSQDMMITTSNNESETEPKLCDTDLRFVEPSKKRSMSNEPLETEPTIKKNKTETDTLFGSEDVDLRALNEKPNDPQPEKKKTQKGKSKFEELRDRLNASRMAKPGIKILEEIQPMPITENGDLVKKNLHKKKQDTKEPSPLPQTIANDLNERIVHKEQSPPKIALPNMHTQPPPKIEEERKDEVIDYGSMTAAELRKATSVPTNTRKEKRKETKWSQPTMPPAIPWMNVNRPAPVSNVIPLPQHFTNPWETNPMVVAMQKQSQMPLVVPQSPSQPILNNKMRTLRLDGTRDHLLRFYGEVAIIFNELGEAHDIKFSSGQSKVIIDDTYSAILDFNDTYKPIIVDGILHQIKFGTPTRELYIDDHFYECYFNNQITQIILGDKVRRIRIEGKAPEVKIGIKRNDIVLGLINMMIDAELMVPVFLDTTLQYFEYKGQIFTLQFADFFLSVIINNEPFKVEFGGLPKNYILNGQKHFIRFTVLPDEVSPGKVNMRGMRRTHLFRNCKSPPLIDAFPDHMIHNQIQSPMDNMDISKLVENDMRVQPPQLPINTSTMPPNMIPGIGNEPSSLPDLNISELLQKLVATGIIGNNANTAPASSSAPQTNENKKDAIEKEENRIPKSQPQKEESKIIPVNLSRPETIKKRQQAIIDTLYSGLQCSSCGLRFPPEQTIKYSQHLDWHFRQNRRERDSKRKAHSRKWYYNQADWIRYEEIEDLDDRGMNFFETQQMEAMDQGEDSNGVPRSIGNQENTVVSCPAGPDDVNRCCNMCHDQFEQFFNEETEEWHLRSALKVEDKFFHPICYDDYKASLTLDESALNEMVNNSIANHNEDVEMTEDSILIVKEEKLEEKSEITANGDDDDVIVLPPEEPVITEIPDETEPEQSENIEEENQTLNATDDDVMIQEPKIETQIVNDDDDDELNQSTSEETSQPLIVKIKEEPKDDGYEDEVNEEDPFIEVTSINEDLMLDDAPQHSPFQPSALDENAIFDESSLIMSQASPHNLVDDFLDDENNSRPDSNGGIGAFVGGNKKLKIVLSSLVQNNITHKNLSSNSNNVNIEQNDNSNIDSINKLVDSNSIDLHGAEDRPNCDENNQDDTELSYKLKPHLQGFKFEKNSIPVKRGIETSGLCSIM